MHGGRKDPLARAFKERAIAARTGRPGTQPIPVEAFLGAHGRVISRRDALKTAGVLGAGAALAACTPSSTTAPSPRSPAGALPTTPRIAVVGAGLAGVTAAYQLLQAGLAVRLFEARDRLGGRCWTSRGWADGQTAEHGGEFIDTRHVHIRRLARDLGLTLDDLWEGYEPGSSYPRWVDGQDLTVHETKPVMDDITAAAEADARRIGLLDGSGQVDMRAISYGTATPAAVDLDQLSMSAWLDDRVPGVLGTSVGAWLDQAMAGWYGLNLDDLSALNWMDYSVIPAPGADERWHVHGGNDLIISEAAAALPDGTIQLERPLTALSRRADGAYELAFDGSAGPVVADLVVLTLPMSTLRQVDLSRAGFGEQKMSAINTLPMGADVKVLLQYDVRPGEMGGWSGGMDHTDPDFDTWESSVVQRGTSSVITVYAGGRTGASWSAPEPHAEASEMFAHEIAHEVGHAVPESEAHFTGTAWADLWTRDPWTNGAYAAFGPGQYTRFWGGTAQPDGNVYFAGEATSTYSQGYLNGGVESGDRAAEEVMRKAGVPVPRALANLPH
ncbi:MAG: flavin monoamine oxidase family protein [Actinomycetota bacterium]